MSDDTALYKGDIDDWVRLAVYPSKLHPGETFMVISLRDSVGGERQVYSKYIKRSHAEWLHGALAEALAIQASAGLPASEER